VIAWQPARTAPIVLIDSLFTPANHRAAPGGDHLDPLVMVIGGLVLLLLAFGFWRSVIRFGLKKSLETAGLVVLGIPLTLMALAGLRRLTGFPSAGLLYPLWVVLVIIVLKIGGGWVPGPVRRLWASLFTAKVRDTHGTAHFGAARNAARHLAPTAPADAFVLGVMRDAPSSPTCSTTPARPSCSTSRARPMPSPHARAAAWATT
jgi:hypothetical protein